MSTSGETKPVSALRRRWLVLLAAALLTASLGAGIAAWFARPSSAPPIPPRVPEIEGEPGVAAFLEKSRQRVLAEPRSARAWGSLGQAFLANDMEDESLVCFTEAERLDPNEPRWPYYQGGVLANRGRPQDAVTYLRRAVDHCTGAEAGSDVPRLLLAETLLLLGRLDEAEEHFRQVLDRQPEEPRAHFGAALVAAARHDEPTSRAHLLRCVASPFARKKASAQLAAVCLRLGDRAGAEKYSRQADSPIADSEWNDPWTTEYLQWAVKKKSRYRLAESLESAGKLHETAAVLEPMVEEYPDDYLPRLTLGKILGQLGEHERAAALLREALRLAPDKVQTHYYLSLVLYNHGEEWTRRGGGDAAAKLYREAAAAARRVVAVKPDYGFAYMPLGLSLKRLGQRADALQALRKAVHCNPEYGELHLYLGEMLAEDGRRDQARDQLEQAVRMAPASAPWRQAALAKLADIRSQK